MLKHQTSLAGGLVCLMFTLGVFSGNSPAWATAQGGATTITVTNTDDSGTGSLRQAILDAASGYTINITATGTINLESSLPAIDKNLTIVGPGSDSLSINGQNTCRVFFVESGTVSISDLAVADGRARGGDGGDAELSGGGGLGAGGGLFVNSTASVTLQNVAFDGNQAVGGNGGGLGMSFMAGGGGGGLGGKGGAAYEMGGGGGGGSITDGSPGDLDHGGAGGTVGGGTGGDYGYEGGNGDDFGGGGGGGRHGDGGSGGFGGGGGGGEMIGGSGGFGGGGGGGMYLPGDGGTGGGDASTWSGGGGAGFGGAIFVREGGSLTILGDSAFSGGSVTGGNAGGLEAQDGQAEGAGIYLNDQEIVFGGAANTTVADPIGGTGAVSKQGSGTLTLSAANTYTGGTSVDAGSLILNGSLAGTTIVDLNGTLGGSGTLVDLTNRGRFAPGNSIGTTVISGNFTHEATGTLEIEINDSGQCDLIDVGGTATIQGGTVDVQAESGTYSAGSTYTFLEADGGLTGTFDTITDNLPFLNAVLRYYETFVEILLENAHTPYLSVAQTFNQRAVASYLDLHCEGASGDLADVLSELDSLTAADARFALDSMSGELHGSAATAGVQDSSLFMRTIAQQLRTTDAIEQAVCAATTHCDPAGMPCASQAGAITLRGQQPCRSTRARVSLWKPWVEAYGMGGNISGDGNAAGLGHSVAGTAVGLQRSLGLCTRLGIAGAYCESFVGLDGRADRAIVDSGLLALYLHRVSGCAYLTGVFSCGFADYDTLRRVQVDQISRTAVADYHGNEFGVHVEAGRCLQIRSVRVQPYAALQYVQLHQSGFAESGADSLSLAVRGIQTDSLQAIVGGRLTSCLPTGGGRLIVPELRALWRHELLDEQRLLDAQLVGQPGNTFTVRGLDVDRDTVILGTGLALRLSSHLSIQADYDLALGQRHAAHAAYGGLCVLR